MDSPTLSSSTVAAASLKRACTRNESGDDPVEVVVEKLAWLHITDGAVRACFARFSTSTTDVVELAILLLSVDENIRRGGVYEGTVIRFDRWEHSTQWGYESTGTRFNR